MGEGQEPGGVNGADEHEHGHQGAFATGEETTEHHPELPDNKGDFAEGQEEEHSHPE